MQTIDSKNKADHHSQDRGMIRIRVIYKESTILKIDRRSQVVKEFGQYISTTMIVLTTLQNLMSFQVFDAFQINALKE